MRITAETMLEPFFKSDDREFLLARGDCVEQMRSLDFCFDMIFADPPYFLSNGGISCRAGKVVSVNKGAWDKSEGREHDENFTHDWISEARRLLAPAGTIWICCSMHNVSSIAKTLEALEFKILNFVTWAKTNPPPNITKRCFTHSTEFLIWARKSAKKSHFFDYELMKKINGGKQMRDLWPLPAVPSRERRAGRHPTQKPLALVARTIAATSREHSWILDPFCGSGTTGIAANLLGRRFLGIEREMEFLELSRARKQEIENAAAFAELRASLGIPAKTDAPKAPNQPFELSLEESAATFPNRKKQTDSDDIPLGEPF